MARIFANDIITIKIGEKKQRKKNTNENGWKKQNPSRYAQIYLLLLCFGCRGKSILGAAGDNVYIALRMLVKLKRERVSGWARELVNFIPLVHVPWHETLERTVFFAYILAQFRFLNLRSIFFTLRSSRLVRRTDAMRKATYVVSLEMLPLNWYMGCVCILGAVQSAKSQVKSVFG